MFINGYIKLDIEKTFDSFLYQRLYAVFNNNNTLYDIVNKYMIDRADESKVLIGSNLDYYINKFREYSLYSESIGISLDNDPELDFNDDSIFFDPNNPIEPHLDYSLISFIDTQKSTSQICCINHVKSSMSIDECNINNFCVTKPSLYTNLSSSITAYYGCLHIKYNIVAIPEAITDNVNVGSVNRPNSIFTNMYIKGF